MTDKQNENLGVVILAAGLGKRMRSKLVKVLHPLCGRPMLSYVLDLAKGISPSRIVVVTGRQKSKVEKILANEPIQFAHQKEQLGTGHAVSFARDQLKDFRGEIIILSGDVPLLTLETLDGLVSCHRDKGPGATILTAILDDPGSYGRIVRSEGEVLGIVEEEDASEDIRSVREINTGIYVFTASLLWAALSEVEPDNVQEEYYLTDVIEIIREKGGAVTGFPAPDPEEVMGINTRESLAEARSILQMRIHKEHMLAGVTIVDPTTTEIDWGVKIGKDTVVHPFTSLKGETLIDEQCEIGPHAVIVDSKIGRAAEIGSFVRLEGSTLPPEESNPRSR